MATDKARDPDLGTGNDALLKEIRDFFTYADDYWRDTRTERKTDMRYVAGDPWDPKDRQMRKAAGRPCIALDELGQYFNQVINDVRANPRAMQFEPSGSGAEQDAEAIKKTAEFYANKAREIEYRSHAQIAYTTAFENMLHGSYGWVRVRTKFVKGSFNQDLWIEDIPDPDMVLADPDSTRPDSSDMKRCLVYQLKPIEDFRREWPKAEIKDFSGYRETLPLWVKENTVVVAEYWTIKTTKRRLLLLKPPPAPPPMGLGLRPTPPPVPIEVYEDELPVTPRPEEVLRSRMEEIPTVCQYFTNGVEILSKTEWPGAYIPLVSCYGKVLYVDEGSGPKRKLLSMTRLARDPYMSYCFYRTCEIENVGMTTKNPYWAYEGQLSAEHMNEIAKSLHEPVAVLLARATTDATGTQVLPLPKRNVDEAQIQALSVGAEEMRRAIQAAMGGNFLPTSAQRQNEKSGKALDRITESQQKGTFHFIDHYEDLIRHVGVVIEDLMDKVYDAARTVGVRQADGTSRMVPINDPSNPKAVSTKGDHLVIVSTGQSFDSERAEAKELVNSLLQTPFAPRIADLAIKLHGGGPLVDKMAERLKPSDIHEDEDGKITPEMMRKRLVELEQFAQQATQRVQEMTEERNSKLLDLQSKEKIAEMEMATKLRIGEMTAKVDVAMQRAELMAEKFELLLNQAHDVGMAGAQQAHDGDMADRQHQQALEQGQQSGALAMAQQAQAAESQPGATA